MYMKDSSVVKVLTLRYFPVVIHKFSIKMILNMINVHRYEFINVYIEYVIIKGC